MIGRLSQSGNLGLRKKDEEGSSLYCTDVESSLVMLTLQTGFLLSVRIFLDMATWPAISVRGENLFASVTNNF